MCDIFAQTFSFQNNWPMSAQSKIHVNILRKRNEQNVLSFIFKIFIYIFLTRPKLFRKLIGSFLKF